ncbi:hypothetical protein MSG28_004561 [Choristoneura fumiferana]|uniref:Uncharacterized protein n=1 Tax=Choristoneura fumiferana TaxID=7141 RepID=A0ACC0K6J5_CHOFU|nr:hypothetical protein MSG28_004561 [Choristoneura fumiferana]
MKSNISLENCASERSERARRFGVEATWIVQVQKAKAGAKRSVAPALAFDPSSSERRPVPSSGTYIGWDDDDDDDSISFVNRTNYFKRAQSTDHRGHKFTILPIYVPLQGTGLPSEREGLGSSSHAGPVLIGNFTHTIEWLRSSISIIYHFYFYTKVSQSSPKTNGQAQMCDRSEAVLPITFLALAIAI